MVGEVEGSDETGHWFNNIDIKQLLILHLISGKYHHRVYIPTWPPLDSCEYMHHVLIYVVGKLCS